MAEKRPKVLLLVGEPNLREVNRIILDEAGYEVEEIPPNADPVQFAEKTGPDVVVVYIAPAEPYSSDIVDQFVANATTQRIPIVAISLSEETAAEAQAGPNVAQTVVAPYDIESLEAAIVSALRNPLPAVALPEHEPAARHHVSVAANAVDRNTRRIALRAITRLGKGEPYRSHFQKPTREFVDDLGTILGAIAIGLQRGLSSEEVFSAQGVRRLLENHAALRESQGVDPSAVAREYQVLREEVIAFLRQRVGQEGFTSDNALDVIQQLEPYFNLAVRITIEQFWRRS